MLLCPCDALVCKRRHDGARDSINARTPHINFASLHLTAAQYRTIAASLPLLYCWIKGWIHRFLRWVHRTLPVICHIIKLPALPAV